MTLKDKIASDLNNVFFNLDEFGEEHEIEGTVVSCVFDDSTLREKSGGAEFAIGSDNLLLYARTEDLPPRQGYGTSLLVDGKDYTVVEWYEDMGMSSVTLTISQ